MKVYLCGPINGRTDEEARNWREVVKGVFPRSLDPMRRDYRGRELEPGVAEEIVRGDIEDINACDAVLVFFDKPSVGTSMEMFYAKQIGRPVVLIDAQDKPLSPWLVYHADAICKSMDEAMVALRGMA